MICNEYLNEVYNTLHAMPEIGFEEYKTASYLASELKKYGYQVIENVGGSTGVLGILDSGKDGPVFGLRADMDALAYEIDGKMECRHTCGHDSHSAMVMAAARAAAEQGISSGKLYIIFQAAEEKLGGAMKFVESGLLNDMDEVIGIHIRPKEDMKVGQASAAIYHSAGAPTRIRIKGLTAHGARPHLGVNAVDAAVLAVNAINAIHANPAVTYSIKVTQLMVGNGSMNIIPDTIDMAIDIRCQDNQEMELLLEKMRNAVTYAVKAVGAEIESMVSDFVPAAEYSEESKELNRQIIREVMGEEALLPDLQNPGGEDFHWFIRKLGCKAGYLALGTEASPGLHHKDMTLNVSALPAGGNMLLKAVEKRLGLQS